MERFSERGNELLGMRQQKSFENPQSTRYTNSEMDFDDVFGGPPRRYSMQEVKMRYSFCQSPEEKSSEGNIEGNLTTFDTWTGVVEKPVFGEENLNRRRGVNDGFFDDIFKGDDNYGSPRRSGNHGSNSGSRIASPVRPLSPPSAEILSTSLPSQFSLLPELTKPSDSPGLASDYDITTKNEDAKSNMSTSPVLSKSSFSKFLKRSMRGKHESKGDQYRQSPLSQEASVGNLESLDGLSVSNKKDIKSRKNSEDVESLVDGSEFHFSIHKWVHGEVPGIIRLREGKTIKVEAMSDQSASRSTQAGSLTFEIKKDDEKSNQDRLDSEEVAKQVNFDNADLKIDHVVEHHAVDSPNVDKRNKAPSPVQQHPEADIKPSGVLFSEKVEKQEGNRKERAERTPEGRKGTKSANFSNEDKKIDAKKKSLKKTPDSPKTSGNTQQKTGVKGKVRDFVKIFSQETAERSKASNQSQSSRWTGRENYGMDGKVKFANKVTEEVEISRSEVKFSNKATEEVEISTSEVKFANKATEEVEISRSEVKFANKATEDVEISRTGGTPNAFRREDEISPKEEVKQAPKPKISNPSGRRYTEQKEAPSFTESFSYKVTDASSETDFRGSFSVEELSNDQDKDLQPSLDSDYIKVSDAKIRQWSQGRKGNIRSLLSTLQLVLWPESGWKPVPLMNIIEGSGVKRAYQRALLCLHPDKLQQKGAAPHQKYIAEKAFDILQEAWDHFNSLGDI